MAKESKYIEFLKVGDTGKTERWQVLSKYKGDVLGHIRWYGPWRFYCFFPSPLCVFSIGCMTDISGKIYELMEERKEMRKNEKKKG